MLPLRVTRSMGWQVRIGRRIRSSAQIMSENLVLAWQLSTLVFGLLRLCVTGQCQQHRCELDHTRWMRRVLAIRIS